MSCETTNALYVHSVIITITSHLGGILVSVLLRTKRLYFQLGAAVSH